MLEHELGVIVDIVGLRLGCEERVALYLHARLNGENGNNRWCRQGKLKLQCVCTW